MTREYMPSYGEHILPEESPSARPRHIAQFRRTPVLEIPKESTGIITVVVCIIIFCLLLVFNFNVFTLILAILIANTLLALLETKFVQPNVIDLTIIPFGVALVASLYSGYLALILAFIGPISEQVFIAKVNRGLWADWAKNITIVVAALVLPLSPYSLLVAIAIGFVAEVAVLQFVNIGEVKPMPLLQMLTNLLFSAILVIVLAPAFF